MIDITTAHAERTGVPDRRRRFPRISSAHLVVVAAALVAIVANAVVITSFDDRVAVLATTRDIAAGSRIGTADLRQVMVALEPDVLATMVNDPVESVVGLRATRSVAAGTLLRHRDLTELPAGPSLRSMSLAVPQAQALGGLLSVGDTVDVIHTVDGVASYVATGITVTAVSDDSSGALGASGGHHIVVAVDQDGALALATALAHGRVDVVRSTGAPAVGASR